jgi:hypothetical protein
MKSLRTVLLGVAIAAATLITASSVTPAFALGGCGFNYHRNAWGRCVWGGQNQNWCLRATGHRAVYVGRGVWRCYR